MRTVLTFVMRGRVHVITTCAVCSAFTIELEYFLLNYVSGALIGLATLRNGAIEGMLILIGSTLLGGAFMFATVEHFHPAMLLALLLGWVPVWVLAFVLRRTGSQGTTLAAGGLLVAAGITVIRVLYGDPTPWWSNVLREFFSLPVFAEGVEWESLIERVAPLMTGFVAATGLFGLAVTLMLARWWHAVLDRPGGFGEEFRDLRMPRYTGYATLAVAAIAWLSSGWFSYLAFDWLMILSVLFGLQGISLVHYVVKRRNASVAWLAGLYVALVFIPHPSSQILFGLALAGLSDTWVDYRRRFGAGGTGAAGE